MRYKAGLHCKTYDETYRETCCETYCETDNEMQRLDPEATLAQRYGDEIQSLIAELYALLPTYRKQTSDKTYHLVRENLEVLTDCFNTNALNVHALGLLRDHLWTLSRMFTYRLTGPQQ